jgi:type II secretory pathway pseudopilin PulG
MNRSRVFRAVTLMELTVSIVILGVLVVMAIPGLRSVVDALHTRSTESTVISALQSAWDKAGYPGSSAFTRASVKLSVPSGLTPIFDSPYTLTSDKVIIFALDPATGSLQAAALAGSGHCTTGSVSPAGQVTISTHPTAGAQCLPVGRLSPLPD